MDTLSAHRVAWMIVLIPQILTHIHKRLYKHSYKLLTIDWMCHYTLGCVIMIDRAAHPHIGAHSKEEVCEQAHIQFIFLSGSIYSLSVVSFPGRECFLLLLYLSVDHFIEGIVPAFLKCQRDNSLKYPCVLSVYVANLVQTNGTEVEGLSFLSV